MITKEEFERRTAKSNARKADVAAVELDFIADMLDDIEATRKANANRLGAMTRSTEDKDGETRGLGLDERDPRVAIVAGMVGELQKIEDVGVRLLEKEVKRHALGPWIMAQKGVGLKQAGRLLASVGDPYLKEWMDADGNRQTEPRTVSQLWAFCGHGDPSRKPREGMSQAEMFRLGNPKAKSRVWLIANSIVRAGGPWRDVYDKRKENTAGRVHADACRRCGPSGHPAQPDSPWPDAHRHADALRVLGKEFLKAMWLEAKRLHDERAAMLGDA